MNTDDAKAALIEALRKVLEFNGVCGVELSDDLVPAEIGGFDSLNALEVVAALDLKPGCLGRGNPFVSGRRPLTVREIAERIARAKKAAECA